ncbi:M14 family metallopeptidase [Mucilaginibacter jinjuensis]|uniref:M14 family metallopeptidase n=1 Tax=Mucilaginibacter jinjuensis TaxID=1176721 RepID=A0ABY7T5Y3_9SPHI|nr:M14 family metallopeptidase [Mucilaginibacter jinjuensis]WCT10672.1 M14 family metallopeptidase [Mucilaginibacter jinjuensis]
MKTTFKITSLLFGLLLFSVQIVSAQSNYYFPKAQALDSKIPTPEQFLGYPIGSFYTRHDQVVAYFRELARVSNRIHVQSIGHTYENREQIIATVTSPENFGRLDQIRQEHLNQIDPAKPVISSSAPVIIHLGYGVHGNETSSTEVSLLVAYYLAASNDPETLKWLQESVIFIDPSLNPDGRDRAANWHNSFHSNPPVADPADKEHQEGWPQGRTNHYYTDLNRDWLNLVQVESRNRVEFFHQWYPNVQIDFHEQGTSATYYFEPTPKSHYSPIIPQFLYDEGIVLAKYNAEALDNIGSLYFTKEGYDNLSPIYGSTYPKFYGAVAATYEQASSRGIVQESANGIPLTFAFSIRNHLTTSFSTIRASVAEKAGLFKTQKDFFKYALEQGQKSTTKAYVFGDAKDVNLTQKFLGLLLQHRIKVYQLADNVAQDGKNFQKGKAYIVPSDQPNYLIVHSIFEENALTDSIYYDNTGWSIIHAYGLKYARLAAPTAKGALVNSVELTNGTVEGGKSNLAYLLNYTDYNASRALYHLLTKQILVRAAFKPFTAGTAAGKRSYGSGSLVIPVVGQTVSPDSLYKALQEVAVETHLNFAAVNTGYSLEGIDLGSSNIRAIKKPEVALAFGQGVTASEAGQVWFLLNQQLDLPVAKIDPASFQRADLSRYTVLILPGGAYNAWDKATVDKIKDWVSNGGTLITFQTASAWAIEHGIANEKVVPATFGGRDGNAQATTAVANTTAPAEQQAPAGGRRAGAPAAKPASADSTHQTPATGRRRSESGRLDFARQEEVEGAKRVNGAIFQADLDITNPIAFGVTSRKLFINKNGATILQPSANRYTTVAQYNAKPFVNGYAPRESVSSVANSAAIILSSSGRGKVVLFADDPTYRGYWLGTGRLFINSLFFANLAGGRAGGQQEEEQ